MPPEPDGRLRKGALRRAELIAATLRVVGRDGAAAVTQRAVAAEAGLAPSVVLYHFATVDDLLVATLAQVNDRWLEALAVAAAAPDALGALVALLVRAAEQERALTVAETELWALGARRADLRAECLRWESALGEVTARLAADPVAAEALALVLDGVFLRIATGDDLRIDLLDPVLRRVAGH